MPTGSAGSPPVALRDELGNPLFDELAANLYDETGSQGQVLSTVLMVATGHVQTTFLGAIYGRLGQAIILQEDGVSGILTEASDRLAQEDFVDVVLMETGDALLTEGSDRIGTETGAANYAATLGTVTLSATGSGANIINGSLGIVYAATDRLLFDDPVLSYRLLLEDGSSFILEGAQGYQLPGVGQAAQGVASGLGAPTGTLAVTLATITQTATGINYGTRTGSLAQTLVSVGLMATGVPVKDSAQHGGRDDVVHPIPGHRETARTPTRGRRTSVALTPGNRHG